MSGLGLILSGGGARGAYEVGILEYIFNEFSDDPFLALSETHLTFEPGEFVSVVGPSGCGKSTLMLIAAGLPNWADEHIQFDLLYRRMSPRWQRVSRMVGNLLLVVVFALPIPAMWDYLAFIGADSVTGLPLKFNLAFAVVLWFLVATVFHRGRLLVKDVRDIARERADRSGDT